MSFYYFQMGNMHTEKEACHRGKGEGNLGPCQSKERIEGGSLSQP